MFFSWLLGTVAGTLFPWLLATGSVAGAAGFAAFRAGVAAMPGPAMPSHPELEEIQRFEPSLLSCRGELLDVAAEAAPPTGQLAAFGQGHQQGLETAPAGGVGVDPDLD